MCMPCANCILMRGREIEELNSNGLLMFSKNCLMISHMNLARYDENIKQDNSSETGNKIT